MGTWKKPPPKVDELIKGIEIKKYLQNMKVKNVTSYIFNHYSDHVDL